MEENPFVFGKSVEGNYFTDRDEETKRLESNLTHGINTVLISPRRWGKTSLVKKVIANNKRDDIRYVLLDMFYCKSEAAFYHLLANEIIKQTSSKLDEWIENGKRFLSNITPKFSFGSDPLNDFSISFEWNPKDGTDIEILQLPEKIAEKKGIRVVVCFDEFQQIGTFDDPLNFQKKLRSVWQHQRNVTYCMFGSKMHMMESMFSNASCPLYKFGDILFLKKIPTKEWVSFIISRFSATDKTITEEQAERICNITDNLSSYVQQMAWIVWYKANPVVTDSMIDDATKDLLEQNKVFFQRDVESLTELQLNFIVALADGMETGLTKNEVIKNYHLQTSANVQGIKKSLMSKEFIDTEGERIYISDPIFKLWIKKTVRVR